MFVEELHGAGKAPPKMTANGLRTFLSEVSEGMFQLAAADRAAGQPPLLPTGVMSAFNSERAVVPPTSDHSSVASRAHSWLLRGSPINGHLHM